MSFTWKEEYLDLILVPLGLLLMFSYHLFLLYRYLRFPLTTEMGCEDHYKKEWVENSMKLDTQDEGPMVTVVNSNMVAGTTMASITLVLSSLIGAWIGNSSHDNILSNSVIYGNNSLAITSIKYIALLFCFLTAFAAFVQTIRNYTLAAFLISMPKSGIPATYILQPIIRGSNYWVIGMRALYFAGTLMLWIFGPIPMFFSSAILVVVLYHQDTTNSRPYQFQSRGGYTQLKALGQELINVNRGLGNKKDRT